MLLEPRPTTSSAVSGPVQRQLPCVCSGLRLLDRPEYTVGRVVSAELCGHSMWALYVCISVRGCTELWA